MQIPGFIEFIGDCQRVLSQSLLAVSPNEGCALLIGKQTKSTSLTKESVLKIELIWPCSNSWKPEISNLLESQKGKKNNLKSDLSKQNRFLIDPREQILAQRWAQKRNWEVVGSAHSHPNGAPVPSETDCSWTFSTGLIVIVGKSGAIRAWWMNAAKNREPKEVAILES